MRIWIFTTDVANQNKVTKQISLMLSNRSVDFIHSFGFERLLCYWCQCDYSGRW